MGRIFGQGFNIGFQIRQVFANSLQCITFNSTTSEFEDTKGNMNPVLNQVPVFVTEGNDIAQTNISLSGLNYVHGKIIFKKIAGDIVTFSDGTSSAERFDVTWYSDNKLYIIVSNGTLAYGVVELTDYNFKEVEFLYDGTGATNADRAKLWVDGVAQTLTFIGTIPASLGNNIGGLKFNRNAAGQYGDGEYIKFIMYDSSGNITEDINFQSFSGNKIYNSVSSNHATISGTGSWWTREDGIPDYNQQGCKIVEHAGGTAYVPLAISYATINSNYTSVTSITEATQDGTTLINDGALLDLHPAVSDLVVAFGDELQTNTDFTDSNSDGLADGFLAFSDTSYSIQEYDDKKFQRIEKTGSNAVVRFSGLDNSKYYQVEITGNNESSSIIGLKGDAPTDTKNISIGYNNIKFDIVKPLSGSFYIGYLDSGYFDFSIISIKQITTLSDYFTEIETASGIDLNAVQGGDPLPIAYSGVTYEAGAKTNFGCLIPYADYVSGDELTYAMDDTLTYYGIDEDKNFAIE